ncbi:MULTISPECIES: YcfL family protein [Salinivibrio]|uniref:YcfL family protein n=1 Tax=Salinivibrio TaxID=51366 RepID=UPI00098967F1|nr:MULTISPECIES: YcfL family protein [Salinivibrio]
MMCKNQIQILMIALALVLAGCAGSQSTDLRIAPHQTVVFSDPELATSLWVKETMVRRTPNGKQACVWLENTSSQPQTMQYRFSWYDSQGLQLSTSAASWQSVTIPPHTQRDIHAPIPDVKVSQFRLAVMQPE